MARVKPLRRSVPPTRSKANLSSTLEKILTGYAAAAAGVGFFAFAPSSANAKVVFTPSNINISENAGWIQLDLNHDGIPDFAFSASLRIGSVHPPLGLYAASLLVMPAQAGNEIRALESHSFQCAAKLRGKVLVGPGKPFKPNQLTMFEVAGDYTNQFSVHCPWGNRTGGYLGLKFVINGETHYGWARIAEIGTKFAAIRGYAYETIPDQPITTGVTAGPEDAQSSETPGLNTPHAGSLGALAQGAAALNTWRKP